ncbi:hypothetical protein BBP40_009201 [Aspergillus hancockii]|nr:hypothetical protein BBP40_009201 [Aspergillus hancockii]
MLLFSVLSYAGIAAAVTCKLQPPGDVHCRTCPGTCCPIKTTFKPNSNQDFKCVWPQGENFQGKKRWGYVADKDCYIWEGRANCKWDTIGRCQIFVGAGFAPPME